MNRRELVWILSILNAIAWIAVMAVLYEVDAIGEEVAVLEEGEIWILLVAAVVGFVTSLILSARLWAARPTE